MIFGAVATFLETLNVSRIEPFTCSTVHLSIVAKFFHPNRTVRPLAVNLSFSSVPTLIGSRPTRLLECVLLCEDRRNCDGARQLRGRSHLVMRPPAYRLPNHPYGPPCLDWHTAGWLVGEWPHSSGLQLESILSRGLSHRRRFQIPKNLSSLFFPCRTVEKKFSTGINVIFLKRGKQPSGLHGSDALEVVKEKSALRR